MSISRMVVHGGSEVDKLLKQSHGCSEVDNLLKQSHGGSEVDALLKRQQELVTQLQALILPALHQADGRSAELAVCLFDDVTDCIARITSKLQIRSLPVHNGDAGGPAVGFNVDNSMTNNVGQKRRRNNNHNRYSRSLVTVAPHYDGHHWRKYGHKSINGRQYARSYYRCAYRERDCSASKTIQQQDHDGTLNYNEETARYDVVYYGHHTCKLDNNTKCGMNKEDSKDPIQRGKMVGEGEADIEEFGQGNLDVIALLEVLDDSQLNWDIIC